MSRRPTGLSGRSSCRRGWPLFSLLLAALLVALSPASAFVSSSPPRPCSSSSSCSRLGKRAERLVPLHGIKRKVKVEMEENVRERRPNQSKMLRSVARPGKGAGCAALTLVGWSTCVAGIVSSVVTLNGTKQACWWSVSQTCVSRAPPRCYCCSAPVFDSMCKRLHRRRCSLTKIPEFRDFRLQFPWLPS